MLIACSDCHRQYDTTSLEPGAKVRCLCSKLLEVKKRRAKDQLMVKCSSCGGDLKKDAKECGYCGSGVTLAERGYGSTCPECYALMSKGAKFCSTCGTSIKPVARLQPLQDKACPRCEGQLALEEFEQGALTECTSCGGIWLEEKKFEALTKDAEANAVAQFVRGRGAAAEDAAEPVREQDFKYIKCPTCDEFMNRKNFARCSGVVVDWCRGHGYWFDRHELEAVIKFVEAGGMQKAREREQITKSYTGAAAPRVDLPIYEKPGLGRRDRDEGSFLDVVSGILRNLF